MRRQRLLSRWCQNAPVCRRRQDSGPAVAILSFLRLHKHTRTRGPLEHQKQHMKGHLQSRGGFLQQRLDKVLCNAVTQRSLLLDHTCMPGSSAQLSDAMQMLCRCYDSLAHDQLTSDLPRNALSTCPAALTWRPAGPGS